MKRLSLKMTHVFIGFAVFGVGGCQDVQLDSTQNSGIQQTELSGTADGEQEADTVLKVDLEMIGRPRPTAYTQGRDPFRFGNVLSEGRTGDIAQGGTDRDLSRGVSPSD